MIWVSRLKWVLGECAPREALKSSCAGTCAGIEGATARTLRPRLAHNPEARAQWHERAESRSRTLEAGGLAGLGGGAEVKVSQHGPAQGLADAARGILSQVDAS